MITMLASFGRFWYKFIIGDDWTVAVAIGAGLLTVYALYRTGYNAWWLMPLVVIGALCASLWRIQRRTS